MKRSAASFIIITLGCLIGSCSPPATPESTAPAFTVTARVVQPAPAMTATVTAAPTATDTPSATPDIGATVVAVSTPRIDSSLLSPDGKWRAEVAIHDCVPTGGGEENAYEQLRLVRVADGRAQIADSQLRYCGGLGAFGLGGLFWSADSRYLYYTNAREGVPDGCGYWERPILRLDVGDLRSEALGGGPRSPDGTKLATWQGQELVVWDVNQGELARIPAATPGAGAGPIAWSPDSQSLAYVQAASYCPLSGKSYVVRLDLPGLKQTLLLESEAPTFGNVTWTEPDQLSLFDENGEEWRYSFSTAELEQAP